MMTEEKSQIPFRSNAPRLTVEFVPYLLGDMRNPRKYPEKQIRSQHEFVFAFKHGTAPHIHNIGIHGRNRSNIRTYGGINSFGKDRDELLAMHPTVKPVAMVTDIIKDASARGGLVLDAFGGSGNTLVAAEKTKRRAALIEIDPIYGDRAIRRWQAPTGKDAVCARSGLTFAEREARSTREPFRPKKVDDHD